MAKRVVVYGGKGALGCTLVKHMKEKGWWVCSIDLAENTDADMNVVVKGDTLLEQSQKVLDQVTKEDKFDALYCVAGGWAGGNAANKDFVKNTDLMIKQSIWTSVISANIAAHHLNEGGLLTLSGAKPCLEGTSGMIGYGLAKAAVHQMTSSLAQEGGGLPTGATVQCILPVTLDTPMNRKWMPDADQSTWTPMSHIADLFIKWTVDPASRFDNGSLIQIVTENNKTREFVYEV